MQAWINLGLTRFKNSAFSSPPPKQEPIPRHSNKGLLLAMGFILPLFGCTVAEKPLPPAQVSGEIVVITRNSPTSYYEDAEGNYAGLEHDLAELFAKELGLKLRFIVTKRFDDIIPILERQQAHFAAAGLSITPAREKTLRFSIPYQKVQQQVVYNTDFKKPADLKALIGKKISVVAGSSYVERLKEAKKQLPELTWEEALAQESEELLDKVATNGLDAVIVDSNIVDVVQNFHPNLGVAFEFGKPEQLAWAFPKNADPYLYEKSKLFFKRIQKDGTLKRLTERYYGHVKRLNRPDIVGFLDKMRSTLPRFKHLFQQAQEITGVDWRLIAALGYQESHWDPLATSPTGVRGLMMLTGDTADRMGVKNRLDPKQSITAGAEYFLVMKDMIPARIPEPDRTRLALASYNVGYGHLEDARILAQRQKLNPDTWSDLKKTLPLLSKFEHHSTVKHGYARGGEPVIFVENIRTYYDILVKFEEAYEPMLAPFGRDLNPAQTH